jgi:hypothetical protein
LDPERKVDKQNTGKESRTAAKGRALRRTPTTKAAGSDLALPLLVAMHLDYAHLDEMRVTSLRSSNVPVGRRHMFCERRVNCEETRVRKSHR